MGKKAVEDRARYSLGCSPSRITPSAQPQLPPAPRHQQEDTASSGAGPLRARSTEITSTVRVTALSQQSLCRARTAEQRSGKHRQLRETPGTDRSRAGLARELPLSRAVPRLSPSSAELPPHGPVRWQPEVRGGRGAPLPPAYLDSPGGVAVHLVGHGRRLVHGAGSAGRVRGARGSLPAPPSGRGAPAAAPAALLSAPAAPPARSAPPGTAPPAGQAPNGHRIGSEPALPRPPDPLRTGTAPPAGPAPNRLRTGTERSRLQPGRGWGAGRDQPRSVKPSPAVLSAE